ncbi:hypothetical protein PsorP6_019384 [Peronosclerospora sorghi]|nr:hypothetical protein PsorP6_019384 [Peronosclerospora sorghi]
MTHPHPTLCPLFEIEFVIPDRNAIQTEDGIIETVAKKMEKVNLLCWLARKKLTRTLLNIFLEIKKHAKRSILKRYGHFLDFQDDVPPEIQPTLRP